jgi:hypothetical protein
LDKAFSLGIFLKGLGVARNLSADGRAFQRRYRPVNSARVAPCAGRAFVKRGL